MTMKHVIEGLMQATQSPTHLALSKKSGLDTSIISRIQHGKCDGLQMRTIDQVHRATGVSLELMFAWYRMPKDAVLGRIADRTVVHSS